VQEPGGALIGYVHLKDVLSTDPATRDAPIQPRRLRPLVTVTTTDKLRAVLARMQDSGAHLAQVTDAAGAHLGLVTLEDVLTEIIGEIRESRPAA
jgi:CBS domain containing-hemolysin-like protein